MKGYAMILILFLLAPVLSAQVEEEVDVGVLEIWVKVTDKQGKAVSDLQSGDFQLFIDRKPAELKCFDKSFQEAAVATDPAQSRKYIFFFDLLNTQPGDMEFLKDSVTRFVIDSFHESDQGMVFALTPTGRLGVVQQMTANKNSLVRVIRKMKGNVSLRPSAEVNEKQLLAMLYPANTTVHNENPSAKRGVGKRDMENIHEAQNMARNFAAQEENRSRFTLNTFTSIAKHLSDSSVHGHVALIYISGGFPMSPGEHYFDMVQQYLENQFPSAPGDFAMVDRPRYNFQNDVKKTVGALNRMNVTIYSLDAKGLLMNARGAEMNSLQAASGMRTLGANQQLQDSLILVAHETGGLSFTNRQDFRKGLTDIVRDMNEQYLLCANIPATGKSGYHEIEVKVARPNTRIRHRKGYAD